MKFIIKALVCLCVLTTIVSLTGQFTSLAFNGKNIEEKRANLKSSNSKEPPETDVSEVSTISLPESFVNQTELKNTPVQNNLLAGTDIGEESEPNNTTATADSILPAEARVKGNIYANGDVDVYSFTANAGDRVFTSLMTSFSAGSVDSTLELIASDGTTIIETDTDDGSLGATSSSIAGASIPAAGTYYIRVRGGTATVQLRPYYLYLTVRSTAPTPEVEPNDTPATANVLTSNGLMSGTRNPAAATEQDWYSMTLNAGDTVYLSMDLDPERDNVQWNGRLGFGLFGDAGNQILVVDDGSAGSVANPLSEAFFFTVKNAGTYYAFVDSASAAIGGPTSTYNLNVTVIPRTIVGTNCTTYTSTDAPLAIGPNAGLFSSTVTVPGNPRIASMRVLVNLTHTLMADLDVHLVSPAGNDNGLFTDIGSTVVGGQTQMDAIFDDSAATTPIFTALRPMIIKPELNYRLDWFKGENAGGNWRLDIRDDAASNGGTLNSWGLEICEEPANGSPTVYSQNFEANDGGYTHSGTLDEWEYGTPTVAPVTGCNSGTNCWKTDLDSTYNASSSQDLISPPINLVNEYGILRLEWAMKYQMESASFDSLYVEVSEVGNPANSRRIYQFLDATMTNAVGNPQVTINESAGWGIYSADISDFARKNIQVRFHLDSDTTVQLGGVAIDDVVVKSTATTAAGVTLSGKVVTADGRGLTNANVILTDENGNTVSAKTGSFGNFVFEGVEAGRTYVLSVNSRRFQFNSQVITATEDIGGISFTAIE